MTKLLRSALLLLGVVAIGGLLDWGPADGFTGTVEAKPPGPKGPGKKKDHLQKAYDALTEVSVWMKADRARPPRDTTKLFDRAKDLYRDAVKADREEEGRRADELGLAAHDAARGLLHALRADAPPVAALPAPPLRDNYELDELLRRTADRLEVADRDGRGGGRAFLDAARRLYDQARRANRDDRGRAIQLAHAAEAWTHVGDHLNRADERDVRRLEPEGRRDRPRRRPDRDAPPPPPSDN
jgi:hypothetical protein